MDSGRDCAIVRELEQLGSILPAPQKVSSSINIVSPKELNRFRGHLRTSRQSRQRPRHEQIERGILQQHTSTFLVGEHLSPFMASRLKSHWLRKSLTSPHPAHKSVDACRKAEGLVISVTYCNRHNRLFNCKGPAT